MTSRILPLLGALTIVLTACSAASTPTLATVAVAPDATIPEQLAELPTSAIAVDGEPWLVAVARTGASRRSGLMFVPDLGSLDGMLFIFPDTTTGTFWMQDTLIPLDIAFFAADGSLVDVLQMEPCPPDTDCPSYAASGPYRFALEARQGDLIDLEADATLTLPT